MEDKSFKTAYWGFSWEEIWNDAMSKEQGIARLSEDGVTLDIPFGQLLSDGSLFSFHQPEAPREVSYLYGFTQDGYYLALAEAYGAGTSEPLPGGPHQLIRAKEILAAREHFEPDDAVVEVRARILGLREWFGKAPYVARHSRDESTSTYTLDMGKAQDQSIVVYECERYRIRLYHVVNQSPLDVSGFEVAHDCGVQILFDQSVKRSAAIAEMVRFSDFISVNVCFDAQIEDLKVVFEGGAKPVSVYAPFVVGAKPTPRQLTAIPLGYRSLINVLDDAIGNWMNSGEALQEAETMLCSLLFNDWKLPLDLKFIGASQLVESLSRFRADRHAISEEVYDAYIEKIKTALSAVDDKAAFDWAMNRLPSNTKGQKRLLEELLGRHSEIKDWLLPDCRSFVKQHIAARNQFTHRFEGRPPLQAEELFWHTEGLLMLSYGIVMELIGIPGEVVVRSITSSGYKNHSISKFRAQYGSR